MDPNIVGLIVGIILAIITIYLILAGSRKGTAQNAPGAPVKAAPVASAPPQPDDITLVEGIGPKIATLLNQKGISTFAQLAATEVSVLEQILKENGLQFAKPGTWPEQARLAAAGKMEELKALQDKLIAGR